MKIGILSMQRICNYGSVLQAYSLKKFLEQYGEDNQVFFVDFDSNNFYLSNSSIHDSDDYYIKYNMTLRILLKKIKCKIKNYVFDYKIRVFQKKILNMDNYNHVDVDLLVVGSDEVFKCQNKVRRDFFGDYNKANLKVTYAASCGFASIEDIPNGKLDIMINDINQYRYISVRDEGTYNFVSSVFKDEIHFHLDPVLIGELTNRNAKKINRKKYLIVYAYHERIRDKKEIEQIIKFAEENCLEIIQMGGHQIWKGKYITPSPFEMLDYFANADYVITDTFHGCIFSIINHVKFGVYVRKTNSNKISDLLGRLEIFDRKINDLNYKDFSTVMKSDVDYKVVDNIIQNEKIRTKKYFDNIIEQVGD